MKKTLFLVLFLGILCTAVSAEGVIPAVVEQVELNDIVLHQQETTLLNVRRGQDVEVRALVRFAGEVKNARVRAWISGVHDFKKVEDQTDILDADPLQGTNIVFPAVLRLYIPADAEVDQYMLHVEVSSRSESPLIVDYPIAISSPRRSVFIKDVFVRPETVRAGSSVLVTAVVENLGEKDEKSVRLEASMAELGVRDTTYLATIESGEREETEELFLRVPACTQPGQQELAVTARYADGYKTTEPYRVMLDVVSGDLCANAAKMSSARVGALPPSLGEGQTAAVPITITNKGNSAQSFAVKTSGAPTNLGLSVSPSNVVILGPGESQTLTGSVFALKSARTGPQDLTVQVISRDIVLAESTLSTNLMINAVSLGPTITALKRLLVVLLLILISTASVVAFHVFSKRSHRAHMNARGGAEAKV